MAGKFGGGGGVGEFGILSDDSPTQITTYNYLLADPPFHQMLQKSQFTELFPPPNFPSTRYMKSHSDII